MKKRQAQPALSPKAERLVNYLQRMITQMPPEFADWYFNTMDELMADLKAYMILVQVFPETPLPDLENWRPSTPPPGMTWAEYDAFIASKLAGGSENPMA